MHCYPSNYILQAALNDGYGLVLLVSSTGNTSIRLERKGK